MKKRAKLTDCRLWVGIGSDRHLNLRARHPHEPACWQPLAWQMLPSVMSDPCVQGRYAGRRAKIQ